MMEKRHLFWIVTLCLFVGWTFGFWIGIPKHITFSADEGLEKTAYNIMQQAKITLNESLGNIKHLQMNKTEFIVDCVSYGNVRSLWEDMYYRCSSKEWCDCENRPRSDVIERVLTSEKTNNRNLLIRWNKTIDCPNQKQEFKFEYEGTLYLGYCCEDRWLFEKDMTEWEFIDFIRNNEGISFEVYNFGNEINIQ